MTFFVDRDRSGYTFEQREDYQRMRPYLMTGQYDVLIIKDLSRFSRRNSRGLVELEDLRDAGVRIVAIGDSIDYPTHDDWTNIRLRFLLNEMPVTDSSQKGQKRHFPATAGRTLDLFRAVWICHEEPQADDV